MKSMTLGVFAYVLAFASTPGQALTFDYSFTESGAGTVLPGLILACCGLLLLARRRRGLLGKSRLLVD